MLSGQSCTFSFCPCLFLVSLCSLLFPGLFSIFPGFFLFFLEMSILYQDLHTPTLLGSDTGLARAGQGKRTIAKDRNTARCMMSKACFCADSSSTGIIQATGIVKSTIIFFSGSMSLPGIHGMAPDVLRKYFRLRPAGQDLGLANLIDF